VYRFLRTPRWLGYAALTVVLATVMVLLGLWQLSRYHERADTNSRIAAAAKGDPVDLATVSAVGRAPARDTAWAKVTVTGQYDVSQQILARERTLNDAVGFEVVTPLVLTDGSAVLIDRGWLPPGKPGTSELPNIPAVPQGQVTVVGRLHLPESRADGVQDISGSRQVRRISPSMLTSSVSYPLHGGYVVLDSQQPAAGGAFTTIPSDHQNSWMNAGYVVQWWSFALLTVVGFGYLARKEARGPRERVDWRAALDEPDPGSAPAVPAADPANHRRTSTA
jgi:cytochrome oxidase assembly protein ShyY1